MNKISVSIQSNISELDNIIDLVIYDGYISLIIDSDYIINNNGITLDDLFVDVDIESIINSRLGDRKIYKNIIIRNKRKIFKLDIKDIRSKRRIKKVKSVFKPGKQLKSVRFIGNIKKHIDVVTCYIKCSGNNTHVSASWVDKALVVHSIIYTSGCLGIRGTKRGTPLASELVVKRLLRARYKRKPNISRIKIYIAGVGRGRVLALRTLVKSGISILKMIDVTGVPFNGTRRKGARRV